MKRTINLHEYHGKQLTEEEIMLQKYHEHQREEIRKLEVEKRADRMLLHDSVQRALEEFQIQANNKYQDLEEGEQIEGFNVSTQIEPDNNVADKEPVSKKTKKEESKELDELRDLSVVQSIPTETIPMNNNIATENFQDLKIKKRNVVVEMDLDESDDQKDFDPILRFFKATAMMETLNWNSTKNNEPLEVILNELDVRERNHFIALVLKNSPSQSTGWSISLTPIDHQYDADMLFHFNPRYRKGKPCIVYNDRQGVWGQEIKQDFLGESSAQESLRSSQINLFIHIRKKGFALYVGDTFRILFPHRRDINLFHSIRLMIGVRDGNGKPETIILQKLYWGSYNPEKGLLPLPPELPNEVNDDANIEESQLDSKASMVQYEKNYLIKISGLPIINDLKENYELEKALYDLFTNDFTAEVINAIPHSGTAFVKLNYPEFIDAAIKEYNGMVIEGMDAALELTKVSFVN